MVNPIKIGFSNVQGKRHKLKYVPWSCCKWDKGERRSFSRVFSVKSFRIEYLPVKICCYCKQKLFTHWNPWLEINWFPVCFIGNLHFVKRTRWHNSLLNIVDKMFSVQKSEFAKICILFANTFLFIEKIAQKLCHKLFLKLFLSLFVQSCLSLK